MNHPYSPVDQSGVVIDGLDIGSIVTEIQSRGYAVVEHFLKAAEVAAIRAALHSSQQE